jgi:hypothetical protein
MRRTLLSVLAACLLAGSLTACSAAAQDAPATSSGVLPDSFPADFPLPPEASVTSSGDSVTMTTTATADAVHAFYDEFLRTSDWTVVQDWDGVDPAGAATQGWVIERAEEEGVVAITETEEGGAVVRVNFNQPANDPNRGMNAPRGGAQGPPPVELDG